MTVAFFVWYVVYVLAAVFAPGFMAIELGGGWNIGLVFGLAQFLTTFIITWIYVKYANKNIEPKSAAIREELEGM
jgi:integral membrane protein